MLWGGLPRELLQAARDKRAALFTSTVLLAELTDILSRPKFSRKIAASGLTLDQLVDGYAALTNLVRPAEIAPTIKDDPDDDAVLATAMAARAEIIVSGDRHLLVLGRFEDIVILTVRQAAERVAQPQS